MRGLSSLPGFHKRTRDERLEAVRELAGLSEGQAGALRSPDGGLDYERAERMTENALGTFALPLGVATNFLINGKETLVPMAVEEPSVVAAASKAAKLARPHGGFRAECPESYSTGQVQVLGARPDAAAAVLSESGRILEAANACSSTLARLGRGAKRVSCRQIDAGGQPMLSVDLLVDVGDAMGANVTNAMCEAVAPLVSELAGGRALLRILSNYSTRRLARASATFDARMMGGERVARDVVSAFLFAKHDVYRAVTHNKGIMNGVAAVATATGQDTRAVEAAAHAYAARGGAYSSLSEWSVEGGNLRGSVELPMPVGTVGGISGAHPTAAACIAVCGASGAADLACVMASAGLAQNLAAMLALATDGIQKGHMRLHARNLAAAAGARAGEADRIAEQMASEGDVSMSRARELAGAGKSGPHPGSS